MEYFSRTLKICIVAIFFVFASLAFSHDASAAVLLPGNISTCGELAAPGTYTLTASVSGSSSTCFVIGSDNITIEGGGFTISGTGDIAIDARARTGGAGGPLTEGSNAYTNLLINDVTITGYATGVSLSGNEDTSGSGTNNGYGGDAGDIAIFYSRIGSIYADGGASDTYGTGGIGGNISFTDTNLNIATSTISAVGGRGTSGRNTDGGLDLNYSGTLTRTGLVLSSLSFFNDNATEYGVYPGGTWPMFPGSISSCGTLLGPGTFALASNINASGGCFVIASNNVTITGAGYSLVGASTTDFAISAGSYSSFTLASTTVTGFANLITSSSSVTVSGHDLDLSNKYIAAGSLTLTYTGTLDKTGATVSALSNLTVNGENYGAYAAGPLLGWIVRTGASTGNWRGLASSLDGEKIVAAGYSGRIYTSTNSGATWTQRDGVRNWNDVVSSADGTKLAAVVYGGQIYTSTDSGVNWTAQGASRNWNGIAGSADGTKLVAVVNGGQIYTSADSGVTWSARDSNRNWAKVSSSADGVRLAAVVTNGQIYISTDSGATWTARASSKAWIDIASSADGMKLVAAADDDLYTSTDGGTTWTARGTNKSWRSVTSSVDGTRLAAVILGGKIYTSADSGATWLAQESNRNWFSISSSADGSKLIAGINGGFMYTYVDVNATSSVMVLAPTNPTTLWSPSVFWADSDSCYYSYDNWVSTSTANCESLGSDIEQPEAYGTSTLYVRGIDESGAVSEDSAEFSLSFGITLISPTSGASVDSSAWSSSVIWDLNSTGNLASCLYSYNNFVSTSTANCALGGTDLLPPNAASSSNQTLTIRAQDVHGNTAYASTTFSYNIWYQLTNGGSLNWQITSMSADGLKLLATHFSGFKMSDDAGTTWITRNTPSSSNLRGMAASSDGQKIYTAIWGADMYSTANRGTLWSIVTGAGRKNWQRFTTSSDGVKVVAGVEGGYLYTSADSGATWFERLTSGARNWQGLASSADGTKLVAAVRSGGNIYTSADSGVNWTVRASAGARDWQQVTSSADGTKLSAAAYGGYIYTSTDSGVTWATSTASGIRNWNSIAASADGTHLAAVVFNGYIYTSADSGATWSEHTAPGSRQWKSISGSADGTTFYAIANGANPYILKNPGFLAVDILRPSSGETVNTWNPMVSFGIADECNYSWNNLDWNSVTCSNLGSDIPAPSYGLAQTLYVKGTDNASTTISKSVTFNYSAAASSTSLSSCGVTISSPGTYTLTGNITNATTSCFTIQANDVTIDGAGYTVTGTSSNNKYAIVATSTIADGGSAYSNITVRNITFTNFSGGGINAAGRNGISLGRGGYGGTVTVSSSTMGAINTSGGHGAGAIGDFAGWQSGGVAGHVTVSSSTVGAITANGGDSAFYWTGRSGAGGNILVTASTVSGNISTVGGATGFICGVLSAGAGGSVTVRTSSVTGTILSQGGQEGNNCGGTIWNAPSSGVITISTSTVSSTITSQGGRGAAVDRIDLVNGQKAAPGGAPSPIYITNSSVANVVSQGGAGGPTTQANQDGANGANGGDIIIASSTFGNLSSIGGAGGSIYNNLTTYGKHGGTGGNSGNITVTGAALNFSSKNIFGYGGAAGGTGGTLGVAGTSTTNLTLRYTSSFADPALHSPFTQVLIYRPDGQVQFGANVASTTLLSSLPITGFSTPGNISSCGSIYFSGTYTLTGDITGSTTSCFTILADDVTIDGNGHTVTAAPGNGNWGVSALGYEGTVLRDITFVGFGAGEVESDGDVTFEGGILDISNMTIFAGSLAITYTDVFTAVNVTLSALSSFTINDIDLGNFIGGLFNWGTYTLSSCGPVDNPGSYTLTQDLFDAGGSTCLDINTDLVYIDGAGFSIYTSASTSAFAINATEEGVEGHSNISLKDLTISGYYGGIDARGAVQHDGGSVVLNNVDTDNGMVSVDTSSMSNEFNGGNGGSVTVIGSHVGHVYANGADTLSSGDPAQGGDGGSVTITNSTVAVVQSSGGDSSGNPNPGYDAGTYNGGNPGAYSASNSTVGTVTRNYGTGYVGGCTDDSYPNYDSNATYDNGSCSLPDIGTGRDNPEGNTISGPIDFWGFSNRGVVEGDASYYPYTYGYGSFNYNQGNYGTTTGYTSFYGDYGGIGTDVGNYGYVGNGAYFNYTAANFGTVDGDVYFDYDSGNSGTVNGNSQLYGWQFDNNGTLNGDVTFADVYYFYNYGTVTGSFINFPYYDFGNYGTINGNADFTNYGSFYGYNYGTVNGDAVFYSNDDYYGRYNQGIVTGTITNLYGCTDPSASNYDPTSSYDNGYCVYYGQNADLPEGVTYTGDLSFDYGYSNYGTVNGNATFSAGAYSFNYGTTTGDATFNGYNTSGTGIYTLNGGPYAGTGRVGGTVYDEESNPIESFVFEEGYNNDFVLSVDATFNGSSCNVSTILANALFNDTSCNNGTVDGDATFNTTFYSPTLPENGVFVFESNDWVGIVNGAIYGGDSNPITQFAFYGSTRNVSTINLDTIFHDSSRNEGIINGDMVLDTDYYSGIAPTSSILTLAGNAEWRGEVNGTIYASDGITPITSLSFTGSSKNYTTITGNPTFSGAASNYGTIIGNPTFNNTSPFRIGTVVGTATLGGTSQTLSGAANVVNFFKQAFARDTLYITPGSSINISGLFTLLGFSADSLLTVRSTSPSVAATLGINGTTNFNFLRLKNINNTGSSVNLSSRTAFNDGGNTGFSFPSNSTSGGRGGITRDYTPPSPPSHGGGGSGGGETGGGENGGGGTGGGSGGGSIRNFFSGAIGRFVFPQTQLFTPFTPSFQPQGLGATVLPSPFSGFQTPGNISLLTLPVNFLTNISNFLFAPIPRTITEALSSAPKLQSLIASAGFSKEQDLVSLASKPLPLTIPATQDVPPGLFLIRSGGMDVPTYVTYEGGLAQLIKVLPNQSLTISFIPLSTGPVSATYLGQDVSFAPSGSFVSANITTPSRGGRFIMRTESSPLPLLIDVEVPVQAAPTEEKKSFFQSVISWFSSLFK